MQKKHKSNIFENIARYTCTFAFFVVPLHREPALGMSDIIDGGLQTYYKSVYWRLFWHIEIW